MKSSKTLIATFIFLEPTNLSQESPTWVSIRMTHQQDSYILCYMLSSILDAQIVSIGYKLALMR